MAVPGVWEAGAIKIPLGGPAGWEWLQSQLVYNRSFQFQSLVGLYPRHDYVHQFTDKSNNLRWDNTGVWR